MPLALRGIRAIVREQTFHRWRDQNGGMKSEEAR